MKDPTIEPHEMPFVMALFSVEYARRGDSAAALVIATAHYVAMRSLLATGGAVIIADGEKVKVTAHGQGGLKIENFDAYIRSLQDPDGES